MKTSKLAKAKIACDEFLKAYNELCKREDMICRWEPDDPFFRGCKESGALRRKSMQLSRSLSELRKPN